MTDAMIHAAIARDPEAQRELISVLEPVIHMRVRRALARSRHSARGAETAADEDDLVQEVFVALFDKDARTLRAWDRERGASLTTFVGVVADHRISSMLRRAHPRPNGGDTAEVIDRLTSLDSAPDARVASRELAQRLTKRLHGELSSRGFELFRALFVDEDSVEAICERHGMTPVAVWAWRSRLKKRVRDLAAEMDSPM